MVDEIKELHCQVCEHELAEVQCQDCQAIHSYCKICFDMSHRSPNKKTHKPKPLTPEIGKISSELSLQMYKCALHKLEARKYVCKVCKDVACPDCFVIGEHIDHQFRTFEDAVNEILAAFIEELGVAGKCLNKAKEISAGIAEERQREEVNFTTYVANLNEKFKIIQEILIKKQNAMIAIVETEAEKVNKLLEEYGKQADAIKDRLEERIRYLKDSLENIKKTINPDNYSKYRELRPDNVEHIHDATLNELKNKLISRGNFKASPSVDLENLESTIQTLYFLPNEKLKVEGTYYAEQKKLCFDFIGVKNEDNGTIVEVYDHTKSQTLGESELANKKVVIKNYVVDQEPTRFRVSVGLPWNFSMCEVYKPGLVISSMTQFSLSQSIATDNFCTVAKDSGKGQYYVGTTFNACKLLYRYNSLAEMIQKKTAQEVTLEQPFDGWYIAIKNGYLYHNVSGTNMVGITDLNTGKLLEMCQLPYASYRNGPGRFKHQGYTDIALFLDDKTDKVYVMYETENNQEFKITELLETPKHGIKLGSTWVIPNEKKVNFCYAFIYNKAAFFGRMHDIGAIQYVYSLLDCKPVETGPIQIVPTNQSVDIHYSTLVPSDRVLILCVSEPYRITIYDVK